MRERAARWRNTTVSRSLRLLRGVFVILAAGLLTVGALGFVAVEHTAQPAFCGSCHNMLPFIETWEESAHADVSCIECHYEPGSLETLEGKFKAITQVAKYITSTESKPYAEVSDQSCLRAGCHSVPTLEGPTSFGRVAFEHSHHLLESRRGKQLQCTSCHAHVLEGEHFNVAESICFTCHFKPEADGSLPPHSDCLICHGPPTDIVDVAGKPFKHDEFLARGVECLECHVTAVRGSGEVRRERCHTCHEEEGHIGRIREVPFLHEQHVTLHKVECFQCHDDIQHGLLPHTPFDSGVNDCRSCHTPAHDPGLEVLAGTGAVGVPDHVSRMSRTMVDCNSCHTGQGREDGPADASDPLQDPHHAENAAATEADCIHCHGTAYAGMLPRWQATVGGQLERLAPMVAELRGSLPADAPSGLREDLAAAGKNLALLRRDRSRGAHNPEYSVAVLRNVAERVDRIHGALGAGEPGAAAAGLPVESPDGCTSACHMGIEAVEQVPMGEILFPHASHVVAGGLDCSACHLVEEHGSPAFPRQDCGACHHAEPAEDEEPRECADCHSVQAQMHAGLVEDFEGFPNIMPSVACEDCHGEAPDVFRPNEQGCVLCHDEDYAETWEDWRATTQEYLDELRGMLEAPEASALDPAQRARAQRALRIILRDGSLGVHNPMLAESVLEQGMEALDG